MRYLLPVFLLLMGLRAAADTVVLDNGDRLSGNIVKLDGGKLSLETPYAGTVKIDWAAVAEVSSVKPLYVASTAAPTVFGRVEAAGGQVEVATEGAGTVEIPRDSLKTIRSPKERRLLRAWSGHLDSGLSLTRGNAKTTTYTVSAAAVRAAGRGKASAYFDTVFAQNSTSGVSETTAQAVRGGFRYDFDISSRAFTFAFTDLEHDRFQELDLRHSLGGGLGYRLIKGERTTLNLLGGGSFKQEFFDMDPTRRSGEGLLGNDFSWKLSDTFSVTQKFVIFPDLGEPGRYRFNFDAGTLTRLNQWLGWHLTLSDRFLSEPAPGAQKNDLLITTGVRLVFGRETF